MDCSGKWALVTGAASGIGQACSAELQARGATVVATDLASLDVTKESDWVRTLSEMPRLDILVHSAGVSYATPLSDMALDDWRRVLSVNLDGAFLAVKHALRVMIPKRSGSIILISSASGTKPAPGAAAYCASKAGLRMLSRTAALEAKPHNIRVNTVSPGGVVTPMWKTMPFWDDLVRDHGSEEAAWSVFGGADPAEHPLHRMAFPAEIAKAVAFLASDDSAHITAADLAIDAGYTSA
jgi:NAD(P)-dependent dehydrogenase (short-subunit alcohol dehydrogenase family)